MNERKDKEENAFKGRIVLWKYLFEYKKELITLSILGIVSALANGTVPYIAGKFFDAILNRESVFGALSFSMPLWTALLLLWGIFQLIAIVVGWVGDVKGNNFGTRIFGDYKTDSFSRLLLLPLEDLMEENRQ